jgi:hypothetical protein
MSRAAPSSRLYLGSQRPADDDRRARVVPVGRAQAFTAYTLQGSSGGGDTWKPTIAAGNPFVSDCTSTVEEVGSDLEAFNVGFATVTPLDAERNSTGRKVKDFKFAAKLF